MKTETKNESDVWTLSVEMSVFAGNMSKGEVISIAERLLPGLLDGTDFVSVCVLDAKKEEN